MLISCYLRSKKARKMKNEHLEKLKQHITSLKKDNPTYLETVRKLLAHKKVTYALAATLLTGTTGLTVNALTDPTHNVQNKEDILNKKYTITDEQSFKALYEAALPLAQLSMLPTEIMILKPYADKQGRAPNTVGAGSCFIPANYNPETADNYKSSNWVKVSDYVKKHPDLSITYEEALLFMDGWCRYREEGRVYKNMYNRLKGASITPYEMAVAMDCTYNNEKNGFNFCEYIAKKNENPLACAAKLMTYSADKGFQDGILIRHTHEALLYLNLDNYAAELLKLKIEERTSAKGNTYYVTSVNQLKKDDCLPVKAGLEAGSLDAAREVLQKIKGFISENGQTLHQQICLNVKDKNTRASFCQYSGAPTELTYIDCAQVYKKCVAEMDKGHFDKALTGFKQLYDYGYDNAEFRLNLAKTYSGLKQYDKCIQECRNILRAGKSDYYAEANNTAGLAYEKKGNFEKAEANFRLAQKHQKDNPSYQENLKRLENRKSAKLQTRKTQQR